MSGLDFTNNLENLKKLFVPMYHLDFDHISDIDDESFKEFLLTSTNLTFHLEPNININNDLNYADVLLRIRFSNCNFDFSPNRKPFKGLKAQELHINNMTSQYLANSIFDDSVISELHFENGLNFIGFLDLSYTLPNGIS